MPNPPGLLSLNFLSKTSFIWLGLLCLKKWCIVTGQTGCLCSTHISLFIFIYVIDSHTSFINKDKCSLYLEKSKSNFQKESLSRNWWETWHLEHQLFKTKRMRNVIKRKSWPCQLISSPKHITELADFSQKCHHHRTFFLLFVEGLFLTFPAPPKKVLKIYCFTPLVSGLVMVPVLCTSLILVIYPKSTICSFRYEQTCIWPAKAQSSVFPSRSMVSSSQVNSLNTCYTSNWSWQCWFVSIMFTINHYDMPQVSIISPML